MIEKIRNPKSEARNEFRFGFRASCFVLSVKRAFTLIETLVAVTILTLAVSGALFAANSALVAARIAHDQLIASSLAQEGVEYVRMMRDNEYLSAYRADSTTASSVGWNNFLAGSISGCSAGCDPTSLGFVSQASFAGFTRSIRATALSANDEKIISTVSWSFHGIPYAVTVADHLTPWQ